MFVVLEALGHLGYGGQASVIEKQWKELLRVGGYEINADYPRCFPQPVLKAVAGHAVKGFAGMGCHSSPNQKGCRVHDALNAAWDEFWKSPKDYATWERKQVNRLFET